MVRLARSLAVLVLPLTLACVESAPNEDVPAEAAAPAVAPISSAEVTTLRTSFTDAVGRKDGAAVAALYADDAMIHEVDGRISEGRAAIVQSTTEFLNSMSEMMLTPGSSESSGDLAYETGTFAGTFTPAGGQPTPVTGKYLVVIRREADGSLRIVQDASWLDAPAAPPGA